MDNSEKYARWFLLSARMSAQLIASQEGVTKNMVINGLRRHRQWSELPPKPKPKSNLTPAKPPAPLPATRLERGKIFYDLNAKGTPYTAIAEQYGISSKTVSSAACDYRKANGLPATDNKRPRASYPCAKAATAAPIDVAIRLGSIPFPEASGSNLCLWPEGAKFERPTHWCGAERHKGSYCQEHHVRAHHKS